MEKIRQIGATRVEIKEEGYTRIEISSEWGNEISVKEAEEVCQAIYDLNNGQPYGAIVVGTNAAGMRMESGVNKVFASNPLIDKIRIAEAQVFNSLSQRLMIHVYHKMSRKKNFKVFKEEKEAKKWILERIQEEAFKP